MCPDLANFPYYNRLVVSCPGLSRKWANLSGRHPVAGRVHVEEDRSAQSRRDYFDAATLGQRLQGIAALRQLPFNFFQEAAAQNKRKPNLPAFAAARKNRPGLWHPQ